MQSSDLQSQLRSTLSRNQKIVLGSSILAGFGALLPWLTVSVLGTQLTVRGVDRDGKFTLIMALLVAVIVLFYWNRAGISISAIIGVLVGGIALLYIINPLFGVDLSGMSANQRRLIQSAINIGSGLYLTLLGAAGTIYGALTEYRITRDMSNKTKAESGSKIKRSDTSDATDSTVVRNDFPGNRWSKDIEIGWSTAVHGVVSGLGAFILGILIIYVYWGVIDAVLFADFGIIEAITTLPGWVADTWKNPLFHYLYSHIFISWPWATSSAIVEVLTATTVLVSGGYALASLGDVGNFKEALLIGPLVNLGYFPLAILGAVLVELTLPIWLFILVGLVYTSIMSAVGSIISLKLGPAEIY